MIEGTRVVAIQKATDDEVFIYGYGVYRGDSVPPKGRNEHADLYNTLELPNPCIELDEGGMVFGFECWWGDEEKFKKWVGVRKITKVDPLEVETRHE